MMTRTWVGGLMAAGLLAASGCSGCEVEQINTLQPKISVDACATEGIADCSASFGAPIGGGQTRKIVVTNPGEADLHLTDVRIGDGSDPSFSIQGTPPSIVKLGATDGVISVRFAPEVAAEVTGTLVITSDASNLTAEPKVITVNLTGIGRDMGVGHFTITPTACEYGEVGVNTTAYCDLSLGNDGTRELAVTNFGMTDDNDPAFAPAGVFMPPVNLPPGSAVTLRVGFTPQESREYSGGLFFETSDSTQARVDVMLHGKAGNKPTAVAKVKSVNGQPWDQSIVIRPLDNVIVSGEDSQPSGGHTLRSYHWEFASRPEGSALAIKTPDAKDTGFQFSASGIQTGLDVVGTYTVRLTVTDDLMQVATADATFTAIPAEDLHVQLTWENSAADLDLHLIKGMNPPFSPSGDCYYENCKPNMSTINWGTGQGNNPSLDVDDVCGYGPENVNIDSPVEGDYLVGVHFFGMSNSSCSGYVSASGQQVIATVRIFIQGALQGEFTRQILCNRTGDYWSVAKIIWGSTASVQQIDTLQADTHGACGSSGF